MKSLEFDFKMYHECLYRLFYETFSDLDKNGTCTEDSLKTFKLGCSKIQSEIAKLQQEDPQLAFVLANDLNRIAHENHHYPSFLISECSDTTRLNIDHCYRLNFKRAALEHISKGRLTKQVLHELNEDVCRIHVSLMSKPIEKLLT